MTKNKNNIKTRHCEKARRGNLRFSSVEIASLRSQ